MSRESTATDSPRRLEVATLAGGCFWCLEAVFNELKGVERVESGYAGGNNANPTYEQVSTGNTGHAETIQLSFDPQTISYKESLSVFFAMHDPTTLNRQGNDVGTQYRSIIFYHDANQKAVAEETMDELIKEGIYDRPIVTELQPFKAFYKAEEYHDDYYKRHADQPYCQLVIAPKIDKLYERFKDKLKTP